MKKFYILFFSAITSLSVTAQTTVALSPSKDNTIFSAPPNNSNGSGGHLYAGVTDGGSLRRGLIRFDLSGIPAGSVITSATLTMRMVKTQGGSVAVNLHKLNQDWGEAGSNSGSSIDAGGSGAPAATGDATWNNRLHPSTAWTTTGGNFVATISGTTSVNNVGTYNWTGAQMIADIQAWVNTASTNFGWLIKTTEGGSKNVKKFSSRNNATVSERPSLSVTYTAPTPVTLAFLKAAEVKAGVLLNWQTQTEFNNAFFSIEHSNDGNVFSEVGKVTGAGTSNNINNYNFTHQAVLKGNHFYRLAQTDFSGQVHYSQVVQVLLKEKHLQLTISPNPVTGTLSLKGIKTSPNIQYSILDANGRTIEHGKLVSNQVNVSNLPQGYYTIMIREGEEVFSGRFLKK